MTFLRALTEKPWLTPGLNARTAADEESARERSDAGTGLGVFLGVVTILFVLIGSAYLMRMGTHSAMGHGGGDWVSLREPPLLWVNTALLILSSVAWEAARGGVRKGNIAMLRAGLVGGGLLAILFIVGQILVWRQFQASGYFLAAHPAPGPHAPGGLIPGNPALAFFYLITALHGLHLIGGIAVWGRTVTQLFDGGTIATVAQPVRLCARYWHFLLLVWLVMFGLLLMT